jgi:hypothetical protein
MAVHVLHSQVDGIIQIFSKKIKNYSTIEVHSNQNEIMHMQMVGKYPPPSTNHSTINYQENDYATIRQTKNISFCLNLYQLASQTGG